MQSSQSRGAVRIGVAALVVVIVLALTGYLIKTNVTPEQAEYDHRAMWQQPTAVRAAPVTVGTLVIPLTAIGTVTPLNAVTVRSRVDGLLESVAFTEGQVVAAGDLLAEIEAAPYAALLAEAEGQLQENRAQLKNAEADLSLYENLYRKDSIARQELSSQRALVEQLQGTIQANEAQVADARLQLSWTKIRAPIDGRLGLRNVDPGNLVGSADTDGLVTLMQMQPTSVVFTIPESNLAALRSSFAAGEVSVEALDRSGQRSLASGRLTVLDNQIDTATGTVRARAIFNNEDEALFPNQFVNVRLQLKSLVDVITIPQDAVQYGNQGTYVYVVRDGKAWMQTVTLGDSSTDRIVVREGLQAGESVVLEGLDRLRDGKEVLLTEAGATAVRATATSAAPAPPRGEGSPEQGKPEQGKLAPRG